MVLVVGYFVACDSCVALGCCFWFICILRITWGCFVVYFVCSAICVFVMCYVVCWVRCLVAFRLLCFGQRVCLVVGLLVLDTLVFVVFGFDLLFIVGFACLFVCGWARAAWFCGCVGGFL